MKEKILIWLGLLAITLILRSYSFFYSVIDWDESLYLLIAEAWSRGDLPYTTIWDQKPPGIYICYLVGKLIGLGDTLLGIRILSCIAVASSAYFLYRICHYLLPTRSFLKYAPPLLYIIYSLNNQGLAANTELFYTPFVIGAVYCLIKCLNINTRQFTISPTYLISSGLLFGIAFQIKYLTAFDLLIFALGIILYQLKMMAKPVLTIAKIGTLMLLGFILPTIVIVFYFYSHGHLQDLIDATLSANVQHSQHGNFSFIKTIGKFYFQLRDQFILWFTTLLAIALLIKGHFTNPKKVIVLFTLAWLLFDLISISVTKKFYPHYFLQALPPFCIIFYMTLIDFVEKTDRMIRTAFAGVLLFFTGITVILPVMEATGLTVYFRHIQGNKYWGDPSAEIADFVKTKIKQNDAIFIAGAQPIIYYLTKAEIPTKYPYPPFLLDDHFRHVSGINIDAEINSIMAQKPKYIITRKLHGNPFFDALEPYLLKHYAEIKEIDNKYIYEIKK